MVGAVKSTLKILNVSIEFLMFEDHMVFGSVKQVAIHWLCRCYLDKLCLCYLDSARLPLNKDYEGNIRKQSNPEEIMGDHGEDKCFCQQSEGSQVEEQ